MTLSGVRCSNDDLRWAQAPIVTLRGKNHGYQMRLDLSDWSQRLTYFLGRYYELGVQRVLDVTLKPGARFVVLEFSTPYWRPFRAIYLAYLRQVLPRIGRVVSKHRSAYDWLPVSVLSFPEPAALARRLEAAGFGPVTWRTLWGGIVAIHTAIRKDA